MAPPRIRQAVLAARELEPAVERLRSTLDLDEPFRDPGVAHFGLENAVFAIGDTFLEVVSPVSDDASAHRLLERRGGDCGYMVMFQVPDIDAARGRARGREVREVFGVELDDMRESHLHPADMRGAIVSVSQPEPAGAWRWGGPDWDSRSVEGALTGVTIAVADPDGARTRWEAVVGAVPGVEFVADAEGPGLTEIMVERNGEARRVGPGAD